MKSAYPCTRSTSPVAPLKEPVQQQKNSRQTHQESMATNNTRVDEIMKECDVHAQVLRAVHHEFLDHGLVPRQQECAPLMQSSAGAFPPLRYCCGEGRVIVVRGLAMFDDLIVNATAISPRAGEAGFDGEGEVRRRIKLNFLTWSSLFSTGEAGEAGEGDRGEGREHLHRQSHQVTVLFFCFSCGLLFF